MRPWLDSTEILGPAFAGRWERAGRGPDSVRLSGRSRPVIAVLLGLWLLSDCGTTATARARQAFTGDAPDGIEFFEKSIRPVLAERCAECHGDRVEKPKGGLVLGTREGMLKGGDSGPAIVPGDPDSSLLIRAIRYTDEALRMPPEGSARRGGGGGVRSLGEARRGAGPGVGPGAPEAARPVAMGSATRGDHWAFRSPREPAIPARGSRREPDRRIPPWRARATRPAHRSTCRSADPHPARRLST